MRKSMQWLLVLSVVILGLIGETSIMPMHLLGIMEVSLKPFVGIGMTTLVKIKWLRSTIIQRSIKT